MAKAIGKMGGNVSSGLLINRDSVTLAFTNVFCIAFERFIAPWACFFFHIILIGIRIKLVRISKILISTATIQIRISRILFSTATILIRISEILIYTAIVKKNIPLKQCLRGIFVLDFIYLVLLVEILLMFFGLLSIGKQLNCP